MKHLRKFNEDITDGNSYPTPRPDWRTSNVRGAVDDTQVSIFNDIESDLDNMDPDEAVDYLKSIVAFCGNKISDIGSL